MTNDIKPPASPPEFFPAPIRHVVIVKTTTVAKTIHYETIARYLNLPIHFINLTDVMEGFVVVDEDTNDRVKNAIKKMDDHENLSQQLRDPKSSLRRVLRDRMKVFGIDDRNVQYHWGVEDSTITADLDEWRVLHDRLEPYVPESLLTGIANNGTQAGPAAETSSILADVTLPVLFDELRLARLGRGMQDAPRITSIVTFILSSISDDPRAPEQVIEGQTSYKTLIPNGLHQPVPFPQTPIPETEDFIAIEGQPARPQSDDYLQWLVARSPRSKVVRQIAEHLGCAAPEFDVTQLFTASAKTTFIRRVSPLQLPKIISFGQSDKRIGRFHIEQHMPDAITPPELNIEHQLEKADALIFKGIGDYQKPEKTLYLLHYFAALVDRQTRSRAKHRPMIVVDDGSLTSLVDFGSKLYQLGFTKNFLNRPLFQGKSAIVTDPDIVHFSDSYIDVIRTVSGRPLTPAQERAAINQILEFRLASFEPFVSPSEPQIVPRIGGVPLSASPATSGDVTVTFYTSAGNDNRKVMDSNFAYGEFLAKQGFAAAWGGGDLHAMGAFANGYKAAKGHHITCVSTFDLLQNETSRGRVPPGVQAWEIYPDITQRRDSLYRHADIEVVAWGGYDTMEEDVNGEAWRLADADGAAGKFKIFFAPGIHRGDTSDNINEQLMRIVHGDAFVDALKRDHRAMLKQGYALATTDDELRQLTLEMRDLVLDRRAAMRKAPQPPRTAPKKRSAPANRNEKS